MKQNRLCYISRNYYNLTSAGNKAKTDNEDTLAEMGAINLGLPRTIKNSKILAFFLDLIGIIRACILIQKGDVLFLQYPVKKYFSFLCHVAHQKGSQNSFADSRSRFFPQKKAHYPERDKPSFEQRLYHRIKRKHERMAQRTWIKKASRRIGIIRLSFCITMP